MVDLAEAARILDIPADDVLDFALDGQFADCLIDDRGAWFRRSTLEALARRADAAVASMQGNGGAAA